MNKIAEQIKEKAELIAELLMDQNDIMIKKDKENNIKVMYFQPKNIKNWRKE